MIFLWVTGTALTTIAFTVWGPLDSLISRAGLWASSIWLILAFLPILRNSLAEFKPGRYFKRINYFVLMAVLFMCLDKILFIPLENLF
jgi:hypothetical protein